MFCIVKYVYIVVQKKTSGTPRSTSYEIFSITMMNFYYRNWILNTIIYRKYKNNLFTKWRSYKFLLMEREKYCRLDCNSYYFWVYIYIFLSFLRRKKCFHTVVVDCLTIQLITRLINSVLEGINCWQLLLGDVFNIFDLSLFNPLGITRYYNDFLVHEV